MIQDGQVEGLQVMEEYRQRGVLLVEYLGSNSLERAEKSSA